MKYRVKIDVREMHIRVPPWRIWRDVKNIYSFHRLEGPAIEYTDGRVEYWLNDYSYSKGEFDAIFNKNS